MKKYDKSPSRVNLKAATLVSDVEVFEILCNMSNRCIEGGMYENIKSNVDSGLLTPKQGFELYELISYKEHNEIEFCVDVFGEKLGIRNLSSKI